jgi:hypothetical protein
MQNGMTNGAAHGQPPIQINPIQAAQFALTFLARADMKPHERDMFAVAEAMLTAVVAGRVVLSSPPAALAANVEHDAPPVPTQ